MGYTLCVLGCGTMGIAITSGVIASLASAQTPSDGAPAPPGSAISDLPSNLDSSIPSRFLVTCTRDSTAHKLRNLFQDLGHLGQSVEIIQNGNVEAVKRADVILLCCKPHQVHTIMGEVGMGSALHEKLLISILAGVTIAQLRNWVTHETKVIRAMTNTPSKIREGMTVISTFPPNYPVEPDRSIALNIFSSIGRVRFLEEKHFDVSTAIAGSGPAFACLFLEAMADGGVMMGLPRAEALEMAAQTLQGAARMALQEGTHPAQIRDSVSTPGGTTIAGLHVLEEGRVRYSVARCIQAATERATMLGQATKK